jgi:hypothetical protein
VDKGFFTFCKGFVRLTQGLLKTAYNKHFLVNEKAFFQ